MYIGSPTSFGGHASSGTLNIGSGSFALIGAATDPFGFGSGTAGTAQTGTTDLHQLLVRLDGEDHAEPEWRVSRNELL